ncbi:MAG TPA: FHA domain-containing protein [Thermoanaerobaculia bacterium]|nr:FHA domain-containing protein [Thermoanaerobaculia bacterium]
MRTTFDRFTLDTEQRTLLDGVAPLHLGPKALRLLEVLVAEAPRAFSKQELYEQIWPDTYVDESNLAGLINEVRAALGDEARKPRFIRTVHGFGYAFVGTPQSEAPAVSHLHFRGRDFPLRDGENVLGRDAAADVQIDDATVSRRHAVITVGETTTLKDLDSKNGTFIDGTRLTAPQPLADGQTFVLGDAAVVFRRTAGSTVTILRKP